MYYEDESDKFDKIDAAFEELDKLHAAAKEFIEMKMEEGAFHPKYFTRPEMIELMIEEVNIEDIRYREDGPGKSFVDVCYRGVTFTTSLKNKDLLELRDRCGLD